MVFKAIINNGLLAQTDALITKHDTVRYRFFTPKSIDTNAKNHIFHKQ